jgi:hypothetical protein
MESKFDKIIYPMMMGLCIAAAVTSYMVGENNLWPIVTFSWVAIAWSNLKK